MWHVSIAPRFALPAINATAAVFKEAVEQLDGVGAAALGEWREVGDLAVHLRRRLTAAEMSRARIEAVVDVRGTDEHKRRVDAILPFLPLAAQGMPTDAFV